MSKNELLEQYSARYKGLVKFAQIIEDDIKDMFEDVPRIDRICARAKRVDKFIQKALKKNDDGSPKYTDPIREIQDQVGARIIVHFKSDIAPVEARVLGVYRHIERAEKSPVLVDQFGYEGVHFVCSVPPDLRNDRNELGIGIQYFELQIRTLYQHAWSEASHDIAYKSEEEMDQDTRRNVAYTAAQSWGADRLFDELCQDHLQPLFKEKGR